MVDHPSEHYVVRDVEDQITDAANNNRKINEALADNNRSGAIASLEGLVTNAGFMLDEHKEAFSMDQRKAIASRLLQAAQAVNTLTPPNNDPDKNPNDFELDMLSDSLVIAQRYAAAYGVELNSAPSANASNSRPPAPTL